MPFQIETDPTLSAVVNWVSRRVGFAPSITDPAGSTDPAVARMIAAANDAAKELLGEYAWPNLVKQSSLSVVRDFPGQLEKGYALPDDFFAFIKQTQNDKTVLRPSYGPLSARQYQSIKTLIPSIAFQLMWRYSDGMLYFLNPPATAHDFTFEYLSQGFVKDADNTTLYKNEASKNGDIFLLDEYVLKTLARVKWLEMMQFDSAAAVQDYNRAFQARCGRLDSAPILSMTGMQRKLFLLDIPLSPENAPFTGYGS
jgi:hypothetical protein